LGGGGGEFGEILVRKNFGFTGFTFYQVPCCLCVSESPYSFNIEYKHRHRRHLKLIEAYSTDMNITVLVMITAKLQ
jgi:hypothetical protein